MLYKCKMHFLFEVLTNSINLCKMKLYCFCEVIKMITKEIIEFKNYGKCVKISNGIIEAVATVDLGPRIVFFGFIPAISISISLLILSL